MPDIPYVEDVTSFWLPIAPTTNTLYANTAHGRRKAPGYRQWLNEAGWRIKEQGVQPIPGKRWALRIAAPVNHRRDLSNCLKATEDLIVEMGLISDDRYIDRIVLDRVPFLGTHEFPVGTWSYTPPYPRICNKCGLREDQVGGQLSDCAGKKEMWVSIWALS